MNSKSRSNYRIPMCIKPCANKNTKICELCIKFSMYNSIDSLNANKKDWKNMIERK